MKLMTLITIFLFATLQVFAPERKEMFIQGSEAIRPYERLIKALVQVESSGNRFAYNPKENAAGAFQIRPIRLLDYNQRTGSNYQMSDMFDYEISKKIFLYYAVRLGHNQLDKIAKAWNGHGVETESYYLKIKKYLK